MSHWEQRPWLVPKQVFKCAIAALDLSMVVFGGVYHGVKQGNRSFSMILLRV
ncbi:hypothetical protein [Nostoc sp.]|uniref:hypothetical protein n=1 Tax=Nostoc sp. TaxID=1180 RepID=UPI002FF7BFF9